ncbi:phage tail tape measure protein [Bacteroides fluxus]|uniref:phage tail tape measure protein n=1 Tax=Bacteroides fluxus TaxID=626930 RepID=UPI002A82F8F6|nr:phage tail tape measure protein [Bacteroides fluxus]MDY3790593.1 phage tail tape measure protein [Bacteroides fluxus]
MANEVEFKLKITSNGKEVFHGVSIGAEELDNAVRRVTESAKKASDEIQNMAMQNLNWDTVMNAMDMFNNGLQNLVSGYDSFNKSMRAANTMAGKTGKDFDALTDSVKELSKTIPMAREELAGGLYQVISNGVPEDNWISFLEQSSKAAVGGIADLGQTVTVTSTIIKNYGLEWDTAGSIQDKIQKTAKNGVTSFEQLAAALPRVSGSASQLGISIDELMAVFATTTGVTGNTAEVITARAAIASTTGAIRLMNIAIASSPYLIAAASAAALAVGIYKICTSFK